MALGQRLKEARQAAGMSQSELAEAVGMTQAAIGALEKRDSKQSSKASELAKALNVSVEWLLTGKEPARDQVTGLFERIIKQVADKHRRPEDKDLTDREIFDRFNDENMGGFDPELDEELIQSAAYHDQLDRQLVRELRQPKKDELEFFGHMDAWDSQTPLDEDEVELPLFREVELAAGAGATQVIENHGAKLRFAKSTLSRAGVPAEAAACAFVRGNSMEPVMPDGTCVGVNTADKTIKDGEIYAIDHGGMLRVKYLHRRPGGGIKIVSQNASEHPVEEVTAEEMAANVRVIGRVFWWSVLR
ncbi:phage repressor protein C with HTH and peptisase S24 domain [Marinobacter nauticus]|nr:phage repressor protein C with HTH and peptisase S24 domain [Marinobacter nauticus]